MKKKLLPGLSPLKIICISGLILALIISLCLVLFFLMWGNDPSAQGRSPSSAFARSLRDYDRLDAPKRALEGENPRQIERRLSRLQNRAGTVEEQLSVLKRRRVLALIDRLYIDSYAKAAQEAARKFPYSSPLAAVAVDATLLAPLSGDTLQLLDSYSSRISQSRFDMLALGMHILAGNFDDPVRAVETPELGNLLSLDFSGLPEQIQIELLTNEFLMLVYRRDINGASFTLEKLLDASPEAAAMGAEFFYDNGSYHRAAELFLRQENHSRAADALALAGEITGARNIWLVLSQPLTAEDSRGRQIRLRSTYNLAASSVDREEETLLLERLFTQQSAASVGRRQDQMEVYSIIRYTRLLDLERSIAILEAESVRDDILINLELFRRRLEAWSPRRAAAEVWILLGNHPDEEKMYEWAAWYFDHQRLYDETSRVMREAARKGMDAHWLDLHQSLALLREGHISEGERILQEIRNPGDWRVNANLGRIHESRRAISAALASYETAASQVRDPIMAAQVQLRISRCLEALGRRDDSRRALEYARDLDPENLFIRRELRRFNIQ